MSTTSAGPGAPGALRRVVWPAAVVLVLVVAVAVHVVRPSTLWVAVAFIGTLSGGGAVRLDRVVPDAAGRDGCPRCWWPPG